MCAWLLIWKAAKLKKPTNYLLYYSSLRKGIIGSFGHFKLLTYPPFPRLLRTSLGIKPFPYN